MEINQLKSVQPKIRGHKLVQGNKARRCKTNRHKTRPWCILEQKRRESGNQ